HHACALVGGHETAVEPRLSSVIVHTFQGPRPDLGLVPKRPARKSYPARAIASNVAAPLNPAGAGSPAATPCPRPARTAARGASGRQTGSRAGSSRARAGSRSTAPGPPPAGT